MKTDRFLRRAEFLILFCFVLLLQVHPAQAGSATWNLSPTSGDWNTAANWTPATVPNGPSDTATFATSSRTAVSLSDINGTEVNGITFNPGASAFTITILPTATMNISGVGITDSSGVSQTFVNEVDSASHRAVSTFTNSATLGDATFVVEAGLRGGPGAQLQLANSSTGGTARIQVFGNGDLDLSAHDAPGVTVGSIEGTGLVSLGMNNLTTGTNNLSTTFSGIISDGGSGGSLSKTGSGKLTLSKKSTYTGGTTVSQGTLLVTNKTGSATGFGTVQVNAGTLSGTGKISGAVTVGTTTGLATLAPGNDVHLAALTILNALTFNSHGNCKVSLNSTTVTTNQAVAKGVTINGGSLMSITDLGSATLPTGTVFTIITNTATTPIAGTFSNLPDASSLIVGSNTYLISYEGGTGNDLTLTVQ